MRTPIVVLLSLALSGCGLAARQEREQKMAEAVALRDAGYAECKVRFPDGPKNMIEKHRCYADATAVIKPFATYPDLYDKMWASRAVVAERVQGGKLTVAEGNVEITQIGSEITAEEQRRNLANRSVGAQESAAAAAWLAPGPTVVVVPRR